MYPKYKLQNMVKCVAPVVIDLLRMKKYTITWHLVHSKYKLRGCSVKDIVGVCFSNDGNKADIFLIYNEISSERVALGTIIHELLHAKLHNLCTNRKKKKYTKIEEDFVLDMERFILHLIYDEVKI